MTLACPDCESRNIRRLAYSKKDEPLYKCLDCGKRNPARKMLDVDK